jgi:hypothetical protein
MHADVGDDAAGSDEILADQEVSLNLWAPSVNEGMPAAGIVGNAIIALA